jgi:hypothetical protein
MDRMDEEVKNDRAEVVEAPRTLPEIERLVNEAMDYVRFKLDKLEHFDILTQLWDRWSMHRNEFVLFSVILISLNNRSQLEIETILETIRQEGI